MVEEDNGVSICIPLYERDIHFDNLIKSIESHDAGIPYEICIGEGKFSASINRNTAIRKAKYNFICQLDGDAEIIQDGWLRRIYDTLNSNPNAAIVGCIIELANGKVDHCGTLMVNNIEEANKRLDTINEFLPDYVQKFIKDRLSGNFAANIDYEKNKDRLVNKIYKVFQCSGVCYIYDKRKVPMFLENIYERAGWEDVEQMAHVTATGYDILVDGGVRIKHPSTIRTKEEQLLRDDPNSKRSFNSNNLFNYMIRWGCM